MALIIDDQRLDPCVFSHPRASGNIVTASCGPDSRFHLNEFKEP